MRKISVLVAGMVAVACAAAAWGDTVKLADGTEVKGTVKQIIFTVEGKPVVYEGKQVKSIWISKSGSDLLDLTDSTQIRGQMVTVMVATASGNATYERKDVASIAIDDPMVAARVQYQAKRAQLDVKDAKATVELAEWCKAQGLKAEAGDLARACLQLEPEEEVAKRAHMLLDHVFAGGKWLTREQYEKIVKEGNSGTTPSTGGTTEPAATEPAGVKEPSKLSDEDKQAIKAAAAKNQDLKKSYLQKSQDTRDQEFKNIKASHDKEWTDINDKIKGLQDRMDRVQLLLKQAVAAGWTWDARDYQATLGVLQQQQQAEGRKRDALAAAIKNAQAGATRKMEERNGRLTLVCNRHSRLLMEGNVLTEAQMEAAYEKAFNSE